jgi:Carboxypeptidase regulatory-like domain/TonB-dependent Receptor Plug Domain
MRHAVFPRRHRFLTVFACLSLVLALVGLCSQTLYAQGGGSIAGTTIDAQTGMPIVGASITIPTLSRSVVSDDAGHFLHSTLDAGSYVVQVHAVGYIPSARAFDVATGQSVTHTFELTTVPPSLANVVVKGHSASVGRRFEDFDRRRAQGRGQFLTRADIESRNSINLSDLVQTMRGIRTECVGFTCKVVTVRAVNGCSPAYFVDGRMSTTFGPTTPVNDIQGLEVYLGPSETPAEYLGPDSGCGVIGIWTKASPY